ncbi:MAG: allantoinase [Candidatus Eisenbacteria bacterium RBG_16_71_46]|nr:MAG: allantoinase [Candidatus Eisenbacteria bacterium RBG_16_71_46]
MLDAAVVLREGRIAAVVEPGDAAARGALDLGDLVLMPGLVDTHVHVDEPGRAEWEGFDTATRAAAAGGVTTLVDMPLNSIPATTSVAALRAKREAAAGKLRVDCGFWGGIVPGNAGEIEGLAAAGVCGFKCFLVPSGVDEFPAVGEADLYQALPILARLGLPLLAHAELPAPIAAAAASARAGDPRRHATWLASRPRAAENEAVRLLIALCAEFRGAVHVVHLASSDALPELRAARDAFLPITVETCPHYLSFDAEAIADGATAFKCAPPIREAANRERLWEALAEGDIDLVASDHSPCPPAMKASGNGDFLAAWGGIASLELSLAATWTGARARGLGAEDLARWMCAHPARLAGLEARKGRIAEGWDADFVAWDPDAEWTVDPGRLHQRHPLTPYAGRRLRGAVRMTVLRGQVVCEDGRVTGEPRGELLRRGAAAAPGGRRARLSSV